MKPKDQQFYDALGDFIEEKIADLPTSRDNVIDALRIKLEDMTKRKKEKRS